MLPQQWASSELGNTREQAAHVPHLPRPCASVHTQLRGRRAARRGGRKTRLGCEASAPLGGPSGPWQGFRGPLTGAQHLSEASGTPDSCGWDLPTLPRVLFLHEVTSSESNIFKSCLHGFLQPVMMFSMWIFKLNFYSFRSYTYTEGTESNGCPRLVIKNMDLHLQFPTPQRWLTYSLSWWFSYFTCLNDMPIWLAPSSGFSFRPRTLRSEEGGRGSRAPLRPVTLTLLSVGAPLLGGVCPWVDSRAKVNRQPHTSESASPFCLVLGGPCWSPVWRWFSRRSRKASARYLRTLGRLFRAGRHSYCWSILRRLHCSAWKLVQR